MKMEKGILISVLFLGINIICSVNSVCRMFDLERAWNCTGLPQLQSGDANYEQVEQEACQSERSLTVAHCIETARSSNDCAEDEAFQLFVETDKYLEYVEYFCNQSKVYKDNAMCISIAYKEVHVCSQEAYQSITILVESGVFFTMTLQEIMVEVCRYMAVAIECHIDTAEQQCGTEGADFAYNLYIRQFGFCNIDNSEKQTNSSNSKQEEGTTPPNLDQTEETTLRPNMEQTNETTLRPDLDQTDETTRPNLDQTPDPNGTIGVLQTSTIFIVLLQSFAVLAFFSFLM